MKCRKCGSTEHFIKECPKNSEGNSGGKGNYFFELHEEFMPAPLSLPSSSSTQGPTQAPGRFVSTNDHDDPRTRKSVILVVGEGLNVPVTDDNLDPCARFLQNRTQ